MAEEFSVDPTIVQGEVVVRALELCGANDSLAKAVEHFNDPHLAVNAKKFRVIDKHGNQKGVITSVKYRFKLAEQEREYDAVYRQLSNNVHGRLAVMLDGIRHGGARSFGRHARNRARLWGPTSCGCS